MENYTYMTLLTNNIYVQGVILLNETLKKVKSKYPLIVLVTNEVAQATLDILDYLEIKWKLVENIKLPENIKNFRNNQNLHLPLNPLWYNTITKLQIFNQIEYNKIIFLDADIMILKNIDHLFKEKTISATRRPDHHLTTSFLIIEPSKELFNHFVKYLNNFDPYENQLFSAITEEEEIFELFLINNNYNLYYINNQLYNYMLLSYYTASTYKKILDKSFFIHFQGPLKPWDIKNNNNLFHNYQNLDKNYKITATPYYSAMHIIEDVLKSIPFNLLNNFKIIYEKNYKIKNYTYMTLLTNNTYVQGVILLNETLKKVKSKYPLIVLVTNEVAQATLDILDYLEIKWKLVDIINVPKHLQELQQIQNKNFIPPYQVLTKLQIFYQFEYDKIIYLDSDLMILKNIDFLFEEQKIVCTKNFQYQRDNIDKVFNTNYNKKINLFNSAKWQFSDRINTGFLLFSPQNEQIDLIKFMETITKDDFQNYDQRVECDETIFELYLQKNKKNLLILNAYFNTAYWPYDLPDIVNDDIKNNSFFIHFIGPFKPWNIDNKLFKTKRLLQHNEKQPIISNNSLIYDAVKIITSTLFSLPPNLILNFSKAYIEEIQSN